MSRQTARVLFVALFSILIEMVGVPTLSGSVNMSDNVVKTREYRPVSCVIFSVLAVILVVADQLLKRAVVKNIGVYEQVDVIKGFFSLYHCRNTGSAFSLFADKAWGIYLLTGISVVLGLGIFFLMLYAALYDMKLLSVAFCLLSSGALGNLIDRFVGAFLVQLKLAGAALSLFVSDIGTVHVAVHGIAADAAERLAVEGDHILISGTAINLDCFVIRPKTTGFDISIVGGIGDPLTV